MLKSLVSLRRVFSNSSNACRPYATAVHANSNVAPSPIISKAPETKITTLNSGLRVASQSTPNSTATVGIFIDAGSRYENEKNNGVAHFLEHMAFKGTSKRSQMGIELEVENIGAHLNAYTSREHTIYYAKCLDNDLEQAVEILSDILLHSVYGKDEVKREKDVIVRESEEIDQIMQEVVFDRLHLDAYRGCSLARPILGSIENIRSMKREDLVEYVKTYYKGPKMVLAAAGGIDHDHLVGLANKYFGGIQRGSEDVLKYEKGMFHESYDVMETNNMDLCYGVLAVESTSWTHPLSLAVQVASGLTGQFNRTQGAGLTMPTRLAMLMEQNQKVESFLSFVTNYKDTGLSGVYFVTEPVGLRSMIKAICDEWKEYCHNINEKDVTSAKNVLYNNMVMMLDGTTPICEDIGRQLLCYGRQISIPELKARIDAIDARTIQQVMHEFYLNRPIALNVLGPTQDCPSLKEIKKWLSE